VLCGITEGISDQDREIVDQGAVPTLIKLLKSCHTQLLEHVINLSLKDHRKKYCRLQGQLEI